MSIECAQLLAESYSVARDNLRRRSRLCTTDTTTLSSTTAQKVHYIQQASTVVLYCNLRITYLSETLPQSVPASHPWLRSLNDNIQTADHHHHHWAARHPSAAHNMCVHILDDSLALPLPATVPVANVQSGRSRHPARYMHGAHEIATTDSVLHTTPGTTLSYCSTLKLKQGFLQLALSGLRCMCLPTHGCMMKCKDRTLARVTEIGL